MLEDAAHMEILGWMGQLSLAAVAKVAMWLTIFALMLDLCPEALAVALEPPLLKCFPPDRQAVILAHLAAVAFASFLLVT